MNLLVLSGRLGSDPESKELGNGNSVTNFSVADNYTYTDKSGEKQTITHWHRCSAFGKTGETIAKFLKKGDPILLNGRVEYRQYEKDVNGTAVNMTATNIKIDRFEFIGSGKVEGNEVAEKPASPTAGANPNRQNHAPTFDENEQVPW